MHRVPRVLKLPHDAFERIAVFSKCFRCINLIAPDTMCVQEEAGAV